jgi:hypothetical protein
MRWLTNVMGVREVINAYKNVIRKLEGKMPHGKRRL